jgi:outer membrane protein assembly factor BamB
MYAIDGATGAQKWSFASGEFDDYSIASSPAIGADGTLYFGRCVLHVSESSNIAP